MPLELTTNLDTPRRYILAMSGASGMVYALKFLNYLLKAELEVHLIISRQAKIILQKEMDLEYDYFQQLPVIHHESQDFSSPLASGSFHTQGMIILPCSMHTLGAVAQGLCFNLIHRAAAVCLKEQRKLILVPRETPLSSIHLKNMLTLSQTGAVILPAMPAFYNRPKNLDELVKFFVQRVLNQIGLTSPQLEMYAWAKKDDEKK